jgi:hypothetical protein
MPSLILTFHVVDKEKKYALIHTLKRAGHFAKHDFNKISGNAYFIVPIVGPSAQTVPAASYEHPHPLEFLSLTSAHSGTYYLKKK